MLSDVRVVETPLAGHEAEVLRLRNENRGEAKDPRYVQWRYRVQPGCQPPWIFWVLGHADRPVGMASIIHRPYLVRGRRTELAVVGDISLEEAYRGRGIGALLLGRIRERMAQRRTAAIVWPNEAARRALGQAGWTVVARLRIWLGIGNPGLTNAGCGPARLFRSALGRCARLPLRGFRKLLLGGLRVESFDAFDDRFEVFWNRVPREDCVQRERNLEGLRWRYDLHPVLRFRRVAFLRAGSIVGYVVYRREEDGRCLIYEWECPDLAECTAVSAGLMLHLEEAGDAGNARVVLSEAHPLSRFMRRCLFIDRGFSAAILGCGLEAAGVASGAAWVISAGDKDV